jgi:hypothetical protein
LEKGKVVAVIIKVSAMMKYILIVILIIYSINLSAQIEVKKYGLTIETELSDTLQSIYKDFLNNNVEKISIIRLDKKYFDHEYNHFLKNKKFYQSPKKWIKNHSYEESIIIEGDPYPLRHFDSIVFEFPFRGVETEFIKSEYFLDSIETKLALNEMFNGAENEMHNMCYIPWHAVLFYNNEGKVSGIYEICFECGNVKIGIVGTIMFAKFSPYFESLFTKHEKELE